ncbi:DISARM system helicase DrmA [Amycolatopsis sp. NPDC058986]|uniref:DISARM system helicase DrmA n=1 Tax=unclassified Amycolatopsis TaxID=2618356 RepID=UPI00366E2D8E
MTQLSVLKAPEPGEIRDELQRLVVNDLLGPLDGAEEEFTGAENPIDRYPLGRLASRGEVVEPETQDGFSAADAGEAADPDPEPDAPNVTSLTPSSLGFTAHVDGQESELLVIASWGRYERAKSEREDTVGTVVWRRVPMGGDVVVPLKQGRFTGLVPDEREPAVVIRGRVRKHAGNWLVSVFLENGQPQPDRKRHPELWIFQVELTAAAAGERPVFLPRFERARGGDKQDKAERRRLAMAYRFHSEFAFGSGTAVHATTAVGNPTRAIRISTRTVPEYEIPFTDVPTAETDEDLPELDDVVLDMKQLAELAEQSADAVSAALRPLASGYRAWIEHRRADIEDPAHHLEDYRDEAVDGLAAATRAAERVEAGIEALTTNANARRAFAFANWAMYLQRLHTQVAARRRKDQHSDFDAVVAEVDTGTSQRWRPFQLAFILLNLPSLADPTHPERSEDRERAVADLLWFPTGGGKTEAYLGLTAFAIAVRRLQPVFGEYNAKAGVAVLMRYTLRLLTIQQFERAATLICAAETLRRGDEQTWGDEPFRIGMWVGGRVTPNKTEHAEEWLKQRRNIRGAVTRAQGSPHQLSSCPWCGTKIDPGRDIEVHKPHQRTLVVCPGLSCPFGAVAEDTQDLAVDRKGLPVLVVDEEIYRHPPSLLIGTVDKFAQLPWRGETISLFGRVDRRCERHGLVTPDMQRENGGEEPGFHPPTPHAPAAQIVRIAHLRPPDLIIQDELHLISGPLGTLVGLYENAVDKLATWQDPATSRTVRPKVIASTATVRRADSQIDSLFNRKTAIFPPPGLSVDDNFFARQRDPWNQPGRRYVGICAHGARIKSTLIRVYVSVLGAAQKLHEQYGRNEVTDPYMTLVGYFNSLRDLGGMRRIAEDDVRSRLQRAHERGLARRFVSDDGIKELTSRLSSDEIRPLLDKLEVTFPRRKEKGAPTPIDVLLATNMIAVGVDVSRLGAMVVCGQPKSTAEYIQATSRVGRTREAPGLVFTVYNWARPRDLSHYESFEHFHATVYRHVEALSVTPFAERAVDRGLTGVLVALVRELELTYNGNLEALNFDKDSPLADHVVRYLRRRALEVSDKPTAVRVEAALDDRLANWARQRNVSGRLLAYKQPRRTEDVVGLLYKPNEGRWRQMTCPTSLRDVEPGVQLLLQRVDGGRDEEPPYLPPSEPAAEAGDDAS